MVIDKEEKYKIYSQVSAALEDTTLEDFLAEFDISPEEAVFELYQSGLIDPELFERLVVIE